MKIINIFQIGPKKMEKSTNNNKNLDRIDRMLSTSIRSGGRIVLKNENLENLSQGKRFLYNLKSIFTKIFGTSFYLDIESLNFQLDDIISSIGLAVKQSLKDIALDNVNEEDGTNALSRYRATSHYITNISEKLNKIYERYEKNQEITSWSDLSGRIISLAPSVKWSLRSPSTWANLVYSTPDTFFKTLSFLRVCIKTFRCWFSEYDKDDMQIKRQKMKTSINKFNEILEPWNKICSPINEYEQMLKNYKNEPSNPLLYDILMARKELNINRSVPKGTAEALEKENNIFIPGEERAIFDLLYIIDKPEASNFGDLHADNKTRTLQILSTYALDEKLTSLERRCILCALVERVVANEIFSKDPLPEFSLKKHLPTSFDKLISLLKSTYNGIDIEGLIDTDTLPSYNTPNASNSALKEYIEQFNDTKKIFDTSLKQKFKDVEIDFAELIKDPRCPNFFALGQKEITEEQCIQLSNLALDEHLNSAQRSYFLCYLLEVSIGRQLFSQKPLPEFPIKQHLPIEIKKQIKLLKKIYNQQNIDHLFNKEKNLPSFNPTEAIEIEVPKAIEAVYKQGEKSFENIETLIKETSLSIDSAYINPFVKKILQNESCEGDKEIVVNLNEPSEELWEELLLLAANANVKHIYLQGKEPISIPSEKILMDPSLQFLLQKIRVSEKLFVKSENNNQSNANTIKLLSSFCPTLLPPENKTGIFDCSDFTMSECVLLFKEAKKNYALPKKVKMPACMNMQECLWLIENKLWSSVTYLDISDCKHLDSTILLHPFFTPSFENNKSIQFPECVKEYNVDVIQNLKPFTNDPVKMRNWLFPKDDIILGRDVWLHYLPKLYSGAWEYASVFLIPAVKNRNLDLKYQNFWTRLDPCSVSLWLHDENYKKIDTNNYITEINAYGNGLLNDDNIGTFLDKFPRVKHVCLTGTNVSKGIVEKYNSNHQIKIVGFEENIDPDPTLCLTGETVIEKYNKNEGVQQQNCQLFIETLYPEKNMKFQIAICDFKNFQLIHGEKKWDFNKFVLAKNKPQWKEKLSLTSSACICNVSSQDITDLVGEDIFEIVVKHLSNEKEEDCYLGDFPSNGNREQYLKYINDFNMLLKLAEVYDLQKLTRLALTAIAEKLLELKNEGIAQKLGGDAFQNTKSLIKDMKNHAHRVNCFEQIKGILYKLEI